MLAGAWCSTQSGSQLRVPFNKQAHDLHLQQLQMDLSPTTSPICPLDHSTLPALAYLSNSYAYSKDLRPTGDQTYLVQQLAAVLRPRGGHSICAQESA
jgi:hypothetical protein